MNPPPAPSSTESITAPPGATSQTLTFPGIDTAEVFTLTR
jgi:hypothetical protein